MKRPCLSLVMPYYRNPGMLAHQYANLRAHPADIAERLQVIVVDDGSPEPAAAVPNRPENLAEFRVYRVGIDRPWNQHGARNLGAIESTGRSLLLTDMDHVVPAGTLLWAMEALQYGAAYMFHRLDAPNLTPTLGKDGKTHKPHPNTFAMRRELWDAVGGYDEDYCGFYGTDAYFRRALERRSHIVMAPAPACVVRYPREVIPDASTTTLDRNEWRRPKDRAAVRAVKAREGRLDTPTLLNFPWERVV